MPKRPEPYAFHLDGFLRREWLRDLPDGQADIQGWQARLLPRLEIGRDTLVVGIGGDFHYGGEDNTLFAADQPKLLRDNYASRRSRLDLAFARMAPVRWLRLEGGRFVQPVALADMVWDHDLRPQGGAVTIEKSPASGDLKRLRLTVLGAQGSHVFEDRTSVLIASVDGLWSRDRNSSMLISGSFINFTDIATLAATIRRQNSLDADGNFTSRYQVINVGARLASKGQPPMILAADYCYNKKAKDLNRGLFLAITLGSLELSRARWEYTYAKVDRDATLAAYAQDDFYWSTGYEAHRGELASRISEQSNLHLIGQLQRAKDATDPAQRDKWVRRYRIEARFQF
jgi:hypothetical protein